MIPRFLSIQQEDFDVAELQRALLAGNSEVGAIAAFTGCVRHSNDNKSVASMELEHYPGMTEASISKIIDSAVDRWPLLGVSVVHRIGVLGPGDQIVYVGVTSAHRGSAFEACEYIMDYLKTQAPFWKKEIADGEVRWVDSRFSDEEAANRWDA
jgi:molybdopterin synthase catalytic subunit